MTQSSDIAGVIPPIPAIAAREKLHIRIGPDELGQFADVMEEKRISRGIGATSAKLQEKVFRLE